MPLDFPNDPAVGDIFAGAGARWQWDGFKWTSLMTSGGPFLPLSGGALTGPLMLAADPVVALHAATKQYVDARGAGYLPLTGGTLAGPLTVGGILEVTTGHLQLINDGSTEDAFAYVDLSADIGGMNLIRGHSPGFAQTWWTLALGDGPPAADFSITRYNDAGGIIDHPLTISRATGVVTFGPIPSTGLTRRSGAAPGTTAVAGVGSLQGHTVNGTVLQGQGSTNDFMLNNKNGAAVMSVPTGTTTVNFAATPTAGGAALPFLPMAGGTLTGAFGAPQTTLTLAANGQGTAAHLTFSGGGANAGLSGGVIHPAMFMQITGALQGSVTSATPVLGIYASVTNDQVAASGGAGGAQGHLFAQSFGGAAKGGRTAVAIALTQTSTTANTTASTFYTGLGITATATANDNGLSTGRINALFGFNPIVKLNAAATYFTEICGGEIDVVAACSSGPPAWKSGLKVVSFLGDAAKGTVIDSAFLVGAASTSTVGWTVAYAAAGTPLATLPGWPLDSAGTILGAWACATGSNTCGYGFDCNTITITNFFLRGPGALFTVDGSGNAKMARAGFNNTAPIAKPTVSGAKASNAALASLITALASYGLITDTTTA